MGYICTLARGHTKEQVNDFGKFPDTPGFKITILAQKSKISRFITDNLFPRCIRNKAA